MDAMTPISNASTNSSLPPLSPTMASDEKGYMFAFGMIALLGLIGFGVYRAIRGRVSHIRREVERKDINVPSNELPVDYSAPYRDRPYSFEEVLDFARQKFCDHEESSYIIEEIEGRLIRHNYQECLDENVAPYLHEEEDVYVHLPNAKAAIDHRICKKIQMDCAILQFIDSLPGVDLEPYRTIDVREGEPWSVEMVLQNASEQFAEHQHQEAILAKIKAKLKSCKYAQSLSSGTPPHLNSDGFSSSYYDSIQLPDEVEINSAVHRFLYSLPGVDTAPYVGHELK